MEKESNSVDCEIKKKSVDITLWKNKGMLLTSCNHDRHEAFINNTGMHVSIRMQQCPSS